MKASSSLYWLTSYLQKHRAMSLFVIITAIIEPAFYTAFLFLSADIVGILDSGGGWNEVWRVFKWFFPLIIVQVGMFFSSSFLNEILAHRITTDMTYDLFNSLQNRSLTYHDSKDVGDIMARATNDTRSVNMGLSPGIRMIFATITIWGLGAYVIIGINGWFVYPLILVFILFAYLTLQYARKIVPISNSILEELANISGTTSDTVVGIRDLKSYVAEPWIKRKFIKKTLKQTRMKERQGVLGAWFYPDLIVRVFVLIIIGYGLYLATQGTIDFSQLILLFTMLSLLAGMSEEMNWVAFVIIQSLTATRRLHLFINDSDPNFIDDGNVDFVNMPASITFEHVNFKYPNRDVQVLQDITFHLEDSETLAIVGSPGSGKSTLTKLIQRLYLPTSGEIKIGNQDIKSFSNSSLRQNISTVEQDIHLFNDSILENIRFGKPEVSLEEVIEVSKIAHADDFIRNFPEQYETLIGDNGVRLSGGQAQRVAIARAILMNPDILIFDDGASALDAKTEIMIQNAIADILKTRTTIITTHRLAIIAQADKILILDKGKLVGFGSHEYLIQTNGFYRQLFDRHFELPPLQEVET